MKTKTNKRKNARPSKQFLAGMRQMAFIVAAGWEYARRTEDAFDALDRMNAQVATYEREAGR